MDASGLDSLSDQLLTAGTALAGLILVFLGSTISAFDAYEPQQRRSVQARFRTRGVIAFLGFLFSLAAAGAGIVQTLTSWSCMGAVGLAMLVLAFSATFAAAALTLSDLW